MAALTELTQDVPVGPRVDPDTVARSVADSGRVLVVLDDDPTGTQSVADLPVLTGWSVEDLTWALTQGKPAVYVMTNSRSLDPADAEQRNREVATAALQASQATGVPIGFVSRGDSTLRGHYPLETEALRQALEEAGGLRFDGEIICPFFMEGGRYTLGDVHYVKEGDRLVPAAQTEFARDAAFGYTHSDLKQWVEVIQHLMDSLI